MQLQCRGHAFAKSPVTFSEIRTEMGCDGVLAILEAYFPLSDDNMDLVKKVDI